MALAEIGFSTGKKVSWQDGQSYILEGWVLSSCSLPYWKLPDISFCPSTSYLALKGCHISYGRSLMDCVNQMEMDITQNVCILGNTSQLVITIHLHNNFLFPMIRSSWFTFVSIKIIQGLSYLQKFSSLIFIFAIYCS